MRYANIKKASQDEQQNQTTTTKINYTKKFICVLKKNLKAKSKNRKIKLKLNAKWRVNHQKKYGNTP